MLLKIISTVILGIYTLLLLFTARANVKKDYSLFKGCLFVAITLGFVIVTLWLL